VKPLPIVAMLLAGGCTVFDTASHVEIARAVSPDGRVDAVVIETNGGATTSYAYDVCIAPHGEHCDRSDSVANLYASRHGNDDYGVDTRWQGNSLLRVEFGSADYSRLLEPGVRVAGREVRVELQSGVWDPRMMSSAAPRR
jgi:hypothetical protein